jgi:hypothetical protein
MIAFDNVLADMRKNAWILNSSSEVDRTKEPQSVSWLGLPIASAKGRPR